MRRTLSILSVCLLMAGAASAQTWTGASSTSYNVSNNWDTLAVPGSGDSIFMAGAGDGSTVLEDGSAQHVNALNIRLNHKFYIANTNGSYLVNNNINIGRGALDQFTDVSAIYHSAGSVSADAIFLSGNSTGNASLYELSGGTLELLGPAANDGLTLGGQYPATFRLVGDSATVSVKAITATQTGIFDLQFGAAGIDTIDATGLMTISNGAELMVDGSSYTGGAGVINLFSYGSRSDTTGFAESISGFAGLDAAVVYSDTAIDLVLSPSGGGNVPPAADAQSVKAFPDTPLVITLTGSDFEESALTYNVETQPSHGALEGTANVWTYTPTNGYQGADSFTFTVNDGTDDSAPAMVSITVTNEVPVADAQTVITPTDTAVAITLTGSDPDGGPDSLAYSVESQPTNGTLAGTAPDLIYTPTNGYTGADSFTFTVSDGADDSTPATVSITVKEGTTSAGTISVNFHVGNDADAQDDHELTGSEAAGLDNNTVWNNINVGNSGAHNTAGAIFTTTVLADDAGDTAAATIAPSIASTWFVGYCASAAAGAEELGLSGNHDDLFNSYLAMNGPNGDGTPADAAVLEITGLGAAYTENGYSVIIYCDSDKRPASGNTAVRQSLFTLSTGSSTNSLLTEDDTQTDLWTNTFDNTYILSDNVDTGDDYSNYTVFSNLTASSFTLEISSADGGRGAINGFQIVANLAPVISIEGFGIELVSGKAVLSWGADSRVSYDVKAKDGLRFGTWTTVNPGIAGIDGVLSVTNDITADQQFYRVYVVEE